VSALDDDFELAKTRLGRVLREKYRLDRVLGVGGMAAVYAATHRNQKQFAVKVLHPEISRNADIRARFIREGYAANSVNHEGAVAVLDDDTAEDGSAFLVMELLEGAPVETLWEQHAHRLSMTEVLAIAAQLLDVLAAAHQKAIVHRDVKPANLFLTKNAQLKVLDFGIARVRDAATSAANMTATGALLGTPAFMPPEQALGNTNELDGQTDLWAVGATMFTLFSGLFVHDADNAQKLMILAATTPPRPLVTVAPHAAPAFALVVDRALAFDKKNRFASATEMRAAVEDAYCAIAKRPLDRDALYGLAGKTARAPTDSFVAGATMLAGSAPPPPLAPSAPPPPFVPNATVAAMSATRVDSPAATTGNTGVLVAVGALLAALALTIGGGYVVHRMRAARAPSDVAVLPTMPSSPAPLASASSPAADAPTAASVPPSAIVPSVVPSSLPTVASTPAPSPKTPAAKAGGAAKAHPSKKDCDPNYTLDGEGNKHFKPECFE
jgi:serine/threonine-protein kinase